MSDVPIIMLTACGSSQDVVRGLDLGADDYLIKPVTAEQLAARMRALLRRVDRSKPVDCHGHLFKLDHPSVDFFKHEVTIEGKLVKLSPTEFRLLSVLIRHQGRLLPYNYLLSQVWGSENIGEVDSLRLYISYLRRKLDDKKRSKSSLIQSEWGIGYRFG